MATIKKIPKRIVTGETFSFTFNEESVEDITSTSFDNVYGVGETEDDSRIQLSMRKRGSRVNIIMDKILVRNPDGGVDLNLAQEDTELLRPYVKYGGVFFEPFVCDIRVRYLNGSVKFFGPYEFMVRQSITGTNYDADTGALIVEAS